MDKIKKCFSNGAALFICIFLLASCNNSDSQVKALSSNTPTIITSSILPNENGAAPVTELIGGLVEHLHNNPQDLDGWVLLEKSHYYLGNKSEAEFAANEAAELGYTGQIITAANQPSLPKNYPPVGFYSDRNRVMDSLANMLKAENQTNLSIKP